MAKIDKKLILFDTKAQFTGDAGINTAKLDISPTDLEYVDGYVGNIPYHSIVFIKDTQEIWTHGTYYYGYKAIISPVHASLVNNWPDLATNATYPAKYKLSTDSGYLKGDSGSYMIQIYNASDKDGGIYTGYFSYATGKGTDEEIVLHRSGNANNVRIFAKIKYITDAVYLLLCSTVEDSDCTALTIKIKKVL